MPRSSGGSSPQPGYCIKFLTLCSLISSIYLEVYVVLQVMKTPIAVIG